MSVKRNTWIICLSLILVLVMFVSLIGCSPSEPGEDEPKEIPIGIISPLSGSIAYYGDLMAKGAQLAIKEINDAGGIKIGGESYMFKTYVEDDRALPADSIAAAEKLINDIGVHILLGTYTSTANLANLEVSKQAGIVQMTPVGVADAICPASDWMFRNVPNQTMQTSFHAYWVRDNMDLKKVGIIASDDDYGRQGAQIWADIIKEGGVEVLSPEFFKIADTDFYSQLTSLKAANVDAVFLVALISEGSQIISQASELGLDVQFFGLGGFASDRFLELVGDAAEGMVHVSYWEPNEKIPASMHYREAFEKFSGLEAEMFGAAAYDAVYIFKKAIETVNEPTSQDSAYQQKLRQAMLAMEFSGAQGPMKFGPDGQAIIGLNIVEVRNGERHVVGRYEP